MPDSYRYRGSRPPQARAAIRATLPTNEDAANASATLRIYDVIDSWGGEWGISASEVADALDAIPNAKQINLHVNSPGGDAFEGVAILNLLRQHPANVTAYVDGLAASAASFIAAGADQVVMGGSAQLMIHDAWGICIGNAADMAASAKMLNTVSDSIAGVYARKGGGSVADWRAPMLAETWYSAEEAVAAGLADRVEGDGDPEALNRFDLSVFAHKGRDEAPPPVVPARDDVAAAGRARALRLRETA